MVSSSLYSCWLSADGQLNVERNSLGISRPESTGDRSWIWPSSWDLGTHPATPFVAPFRVRCHSACAGGRHRRGHQLLVYQALIGPVSLRFDQALPLAAAQQRPTTNYPDQQYAPSPFAFNGRRGSGPAAGPAEVSLGGLPCRSWRTWGASAFYSHVSAGPALGPASGTWWSLSGLCGPLALRLEHPLENERRKQAPA